MTDASRGSEFCPRENQMLLCAVPVSDDYFTITVICIIH